MTDADEGRAETLVTWMLANHANAVRVAELINAVAFPDFSENDNEDNEIEAAAICEEAGI